ncbi:MAG: hypothetical protein QME35_01300 [Thermoanaerobacteraceae bacterium]|nr:hypothetical protein [Thermoanaerobacteraceae bacterium]
MEKEKLYKIFIIELFILFFIRFQIFENPELNISKLKKEVDNEEEMSHIKDKKNQKGSEDNISIFQKIQKSKDLMGSVKPYLNKREQYYIDIFTKMAEIAECHKNISELQEGNTNEIGETEIDHIGILRAVRSYMSEEKQVLIDKFLKLHEGIENLNEKISKYTERDGKDTNVIEKILDIFEAVKPIIPDDKKEMADKFIKNIRIVEALNKAEGIMSTMRNNEKNNTSKDAEPINDIDINNNGQNPSGEVNSEASDEDKSSIDNNENKTVPMIIEENNKQKEDLLGGLSPQQSMIVDNLKSMLTKEQQQFMLNMLKNLKQQGNNKNVYDKKENDTINDIEKTAENENEGTGK